MAEGANFDPSQVYHYRGQGEIPDNVRASVIRVAIDPSVEEIPDRLFQGCLRLEEVQFSEGLLKIGASAFDSCRSLRSFRSPKTVTEIGEGAFDGCSSLTMVLLPPGLASIEDMTFAECKSLVEIRIPPSVTRIGAVAFNGCINLASVETSEGLLRIGNAAFCGCRSLRIFRVPLSVAEIGWRAFDCCSSLALIWLPEELPALDQFALRGCPKESFRFAHLSERREAIALDARAESELDGMSNEIATLLVGVSPNARECQEILWRAHDLLTDSLRENTTTLELALWKAAIEGMGGEGPVDDNERRALCRNTCKADVVIPNVLEFFPRGPSFPPSDGQACSLSLPVRLNDEARRWTGMILAWIGRSLFEGVRAWLEIAGTVLAWIWRSFFGG